jgi:hypothetical protein
VIAHLIAVAGFIVFVAFLFISAGIGALETLPLGLVLVFYGVYLLNLGWDTRRFHRVLRRAFGDGIE